MKILKCIIVKFNPNHTTCFNLIYKKPCDVNTLKTCNISIICDLKHVQNQRVVTLHVGLINVDMCPIVN